MAPSLLTLSVRRKRDVVCAVQRSRQVARLLGLDGRAQAGLAVGVFEMTCRATARLGPVRVEFLLLDDALRVSFNRLSSGSAGRSPVPSLQVALPEALPVAREDLAWLLSALHRAGPVNCFEEMRRQSRDLLQVLVDLQRAEARLAEAGGDLGLSTAA
jgi:hypothetical protein